MLNQSFQTKEEIAEVKKVLNNIFHDGDYDGSVMYNNFPLALRNLGQNPSDT